MFDDRSGVFHDRSGVFDDRSGVFQFYTDAKLPLLWLDLKDIKKIKVQNKHIYGSGNRLYSQETIRYIACAEHSFLAGATPPADAASTPPPVRAAAALASYWPSAGPRPAPIGQEAWDGEGNLEAPKPSPSAGIYPSKAHFQAEIL